MRKLPIKRAIKIISVAFVLIFIFLLLLIAFLPTLISNGSFQNKIKRTLTKSMKREVGWSSLSFGWFNGLKLNALTLGKGAAPLIKTDIEQIDIMPFFEREAGERFAINLQIKIRNIRAELAPGPPKPTTPPSGKDPLTLVAESIQKIQGMDFPLPVNFKLLIDIAPIQVVYHAPSRDMSLQDFSLHFAMPSLYTKPIEAVINGVLLTDGKKMGNVSLNANISDLVKNGRIHPASALFKADAAAFGTTLKLFGGLMYKDGFMTRLNIDFPQLLAVAAPFIPSKVPKISGNIEALLTAKNDAKLDMQALLAINGIGVGAGGGALNGKNVGPLDFKFSQKITTDHIQQIVDFPDGTFVIKGLFDVAWSASVDNPTSKNRKLKLAFGPAKLNLSNAIAVASSFLPPKFPVNKLEGEFFLNSLKLDLAGPKNDGNISVSGLGFQLPVLGVSQKNADIKIEDFNFLINKLEVPFVAKHPTRLNADLLWNLKRADVSGIKPVSIEGGRGTLDILLEDIDLSSKSPRKFTASAIVSQTSDLDHASIGTQLNIKNVHKQVRILARAFENGNVLASLPECFIKFAQIQTINNGKKIGPVPASLSLVATGLKIPFDASVKPSLEKFSADILAGDFLHLSAKATLSDTYPQNAVTSGTIRIDLQQALLFAKPFVPSGLKADGVVTALWNISAPIPKEPLKADKNILQVAKNGLALLDTAELGLKLENISATIPTAKSKILVTSLRSHPDLRIISTNRGNSIFVDAGVQIEGISGLPGTAEKLPTQQVSLLFNGKFSDWSSLRIHEEFRTNPIAILHESELNVDRINLLFDEKEPFNISTIMKRLDATLFTTVDAAFSPELKQLLQGMEISGNISGSARVDLTAGRELALRSSLKTVDFGTKLTNGTKIEGLRSDIVLSRVYSLLVDSKIETWTPLSSSLVRPKVPVSTNQGAAEVLGRINNDLRGDNGVARSFSIKKITARTSSSVPLILTDVEGDLLFGHEKTGLSFLQADLLGGTILARGIIDLKPEIPIITAAGSFSNLDVTKLLPQDAKKITPNQHSEITGEMSLAAPLTAEQRELFEQLRFSMNIRKIGADTIERALYSLDPYEHNEQIIKQRKMLRNGTLKGLRASAIDGAFTLEGEAEIKGVAIDLPKVERLRISELPMRQELIKNRSRVKNLQNLFDFVRADTLVVDSKGKISLKRRGYAK